MKPNIWYALREKHQRTVSDVALNCDPSQSIKTLSSNFTLKPLVPLAKTEKSSKGTMLLQTNISSRIRTFDRFDWYFYLHVHILPYVQRHET